MAHDYMEIYALLISIFVSLNLQQIGIDLFLVELRSCEIIDEKDLELVQSTEGELNRAKVLFLYVLSQKTKEIQWRLVKCFRQLDIEPMAHALADGLIRLERGLGIPLRIAQHVTGTLPPDFGHVPYYDTFGPVKGSALLINNFYYDQGEPRIGSHVDFINMWLTLTHLGFRVHSKIDRTRNQMMGEITEFSQLFTDHWNEAAFRTCIVVVMCHGDNGELIGIDGRSLDIDLFFKAIIDNGTLAGKPKIFIVQACRGHKMDHGMNLKQHRNGGIRGWISEKLMSAAHKLERSQQGKKVPIGADVAVFYSTTTDHLSWRNPQNGSRFIQTLCHELLKNAHKPWADLNTMSINVIRSVASIQSKDGCVQLPNFETRMMKKFHFLPGVEVVELPAK